MFNAFSDVDSDEEDIARTPPSSNAFLPELGPTSGTSASSSLADSESGPQQEVPRALDHFALNPIHTHHIYRSDTEDDLSLVFRIHFGIRQFQNASQEQDEAPEHTEQTFSEENDSEASHSSILSEAGKGHQGNKPQLQGFRASIGQSGEEWVESPYNSLPAFDENMQRHSDAPPQLPDPNQSIAPEHKEAIHKPCSAQPLSPEERLKAPNSSQGIAAGSSAAANDPSPVSACQTTTSAIATASVNACVPSSESTKHIKRFRPQLPSSTVSRSSPESGSMEAFGVHKNHETEAALKAKENAHPSVWKCIREHVISALTYLRSAPCRVLNFVGVIYRHVAKLFSGRHKGQDFHSKKNVCKPE